MKSLMTLLVTLVVVSWPLTAAAQGNPEDDLKATHKLLVEAAKTGNVSLMTSVIHPRATGFMRMSQLLVDLSNGPGVQEIVPPLIAEMSRFLLTPNTAVFRVYGDAAMVSSTYFGKPMIEDPKTKKKGPDLYNRSTIMYARLDGRWRLVAWHTSELPLKSK